MKATSSLLATALAAAALFSTQALHAESTYGYTAAGAAVSATARVDMSVTIPKLIMLRVGPSGNTRGTVNFSTTIAPPATSNIPQFDEGNSMAFEWDGGAPTVTASNAPVELLAYAWTNVSGAVLNGLASDVVANSTGLTGASILVSNTGVGDTLLHPGPDAENFAQVDLTPNTALRGTWQYSLAPAAANGFGTFSQTVTYTASAL